MIVQKLSNNEYGVTLDSIQFKREFTFTDRRVIYKYWIKQYGYENFTNAWYDYDNYTKLVFSPGLLEYLLIHYRSLLTPESLETIHEEVFADPIPELEGLTEEQNEQVFAMTSRYRAINQSHTGSGKTQIIAKLCEYILSQNQRVLVLAPSNKARDEIRDRLLSVTGVDASYYYDPTQSIQIFNVNGFLRSRQFDRDDPYWGTIDWVIADEVELCTTASAIDLYVRLTNCKRWYGFSATADKAKGQKIDKTVFMNKAISRNLEVVKRFGFTEIYNPPKDKRVDVIEIVTKAFWAAQETKVEGHYIEEDEVNIQKWTDIYLSDYLAETIYNICKKEKQMFIPLNRISIFDSWIKNRFRDLKVLMISSRGYEIWYEGECTLTNLEDAKRLVESKEIRFIFGTKSAYRALDFHGISNIMLLAHSTASTTLQMIGRVSREVYYKIYLLKPTRFLNALTYDYNKRLKLIKQYYSLCDVKYKMITDKDYDNIRY